MDARDARLEDTDDMAILAEGLSKRFGHQAAVNEVNLRIPSGKIFGFVGPSGSGKTTTIRLMTGIFAPTSGQVRVLGEEPQRFSTKTRRRLGYMPQLFFLYPDLTVWENMNFVGSLYGLGLGRSRRFRKLLDFVELGRDRAKRTRSLSAGMQRRLSLAATLAHDPDLIFLDEPTAGIDPVLRRKFWDYFADLKAQGRTLFITTQYVGEAAYCDLVGVMAKGRLIAVDTPDGLRRSVLGGNVVQLRGKDLFQDQHLSALRQLPYVEDVQYADPLTLRLVVDDAATAMPLLLTWTHQQGIAVEMIEEHHPSFDDIFVEVVERESGKES